MTAPQSTPLPPAGQRGEPEDIYIAKQNAFVAAQEPFRQELQVQADFVDVKANESESSALAAKSSENMALASANYIGVWTDLTGSAAAGVSVAHNNNYWGSLVAIADITLSEPSVSSDWQIIGGVLGTSAIRDIGTNPDQVPLNSDLPPEGSLPELMAGVDPDKKHWSPQTLSEWSNNNRSEDFFDAKKDRGERFFSGRVMAKALNNTWGIRTLNILGDSISHGANAPDIPNDSWVGVFRKMANAEYGCNNYGFCSINSTISNPEGTYQELHFVSTSGTWSTLGSTTDSSMMNGFAFTSSVAGSKLNISAPLGNKYCSIWYKGFAGGGVFTVKVNGAVVDTIDTSSVGVGGWHLSAVKELVDNFYGSCFIELEVISGEVGIQGVSYLDQDWREFQVNNFSQSGRKLQFLSDDVITRACTACEALVFALGHNDRTAAGADQVAVIANIDLLIQRANEKQAKVYILDFNWHEPESQWLRVELMRAAREIDRCEYLPFPDWFNLDGSVATTAETITNLKFLSDSSHPTPFGHRVIAESLAKVMGFSVSSKRQALLADPRFTPVSMPTSGWRNNDTSKPSAYRRSGNNLEVRFNLNDTFKNSDVICEIPGIRIDQDSASFFTDSAGNSFSMRLNNTNPVTLEYVDLGTSAAFPYVGAITAVIDSDYDYGYLA